MKDIIYVKTTKNDIEQLMKIRLEMLKEVNGLPDDYIYNKEFIEETRKYFEEGNQTTILAYNDNHVVGCASMSYIWIMPTFSHPTGKRAHLMNVYTRADYRRIGISKNMVERLLNDARKMGATEVSLDTTQMGRPLYESLGFIASNEGMVLNLI